MIITIDQLHKICPKLNPTRLNNLVSAFNLICPLYGINTADIFHEFFANLCEESGEFTVYQENLNYSSAERISLIWKSRFPTAKDATLYVKNPKGLAMKVYGRRKDLGNLTDEDGWTFRGAGPIQITGRANFTNFATWMQTKFNIIKTPEDWAEILRSSDEYGVHSACWIFAISKKLIDEAERDEMKTIVLRINGGLTNYDQRLKYYQLAKQIIT